MKKNYLFISFSIVCLLSCQSDTAIQIDLETEPSALEIFGKDIISTSLYERDIAISPVGDQIIYSLGDYKQSIRSLVVLTKEGQSWSKPAILPFSGKHQDIEPFFSVDGNQLYFASNRPMNEGSDRTDYNLWVVEKTNDGWANPLPLDTIINTLGDEFYPSVSKNGNLYFTATRADGIGREDIFRSKKVNGSYEIPVVLDTNINTATYEFNAYIHPDENLLIFSSFGRTDGMGGGDLYFSKKDENGKWGTAQNMGELVNSKKLDYCPF